MPPNPDLHFDAHLAWQHALALAHPRLVGSPGERRAQVYIKQELQGFGYQVAEEEFTLGITPWHFSRVCTILGLILLGVAWVIKDNSPVSALVLLGSTVGIVGFAARLWLWIIGKFSFTQGRIKSKNIVAQLQPSDSSPVGPLQIFLLAHYDSKSQTISLPVRIICLGLTLLSLSILVIMWGLKLSPLHFEPVHENAWFILAGMAGLRLALVNTQNLSPGALDNAAATGILLELARIYRQQPLDGIALNFVFTGAEEWGVMGATQFLRRHEIDWSKDTCYFLNLDGVGVAGKLRYLAKGAGAKKLLPALKQAAEQAGLSLNRMRLLPGLLVDHLPFERKGFAAASLCCIAPASFRIHTPQDDVSQISPQGLAEAGKIINVWLQGLCRNVVVRSPFP